MTQKEKMSKRDKVRENEDKVFVANYRSGGKRKYHQYAECEYVTDNHDVWDIDLAKAWDVAECKSCSSNQT